MDSTGEISYRRTFVVPVDADQAFKELTTAEGAWWPRDHNLGALPTLGIGFDPEVGGEWYETSIDGTRIHRGTVLAWDPPRRVVVDWPLYFSPPEDGARSSEWEVRFHDHPGGGTRVELEHRGMHRSDDVEFVSDKFFSRYGWDMVVRNYAGFLASGPWGPELEERRNRGAEAAR